MGYYVNPPQRTKEAWLAEFARATLGETPPAWADIPPDCLAVVMVDNGMFTAAAIAVDEQAYKQYTAPTKRKRLWYLVPTTRLLEVEPLLANVVQRP